MYIKIYPKHDVGELADYGYQLMTEAFRDLVFCSNLEGYVVSGSAYCVIGIGGDDYGEGIDEIREAIMDVWRREDYQWQPDDLLSLEFARDITG